MDKAKVVSVLQKINKDLEIAISVNNDLIKVNNLIIGMLNGADNSKAVDAILAKHK